MGIHKIQVAMTEKTKSQVREKFQDEEYPIHVIGRHVDITEAMKNYAVEKLKKVNRLGGRFIEATIVMDVQKQVQSVDIILYVNDNKIKVSGRSESIYSSVDQAIDHLEKKLRRYTRRIHEHHAKGIKEIEMNVNVIQRISPLEDINDQIEEETLRHHEEEMRIPEIVKKETLGLKTLTHQEAIMKMELSEDPFLIFRSEDDQKMKVIYRRDDGNYGIIETEK